MTTFTDTPAHRRRQSKKVSASGWIGPALEHRVFFICANAAPLIFPLIFFPKGDPKATPRRPSWPRWPAVAGAL